MLPDDPAAPSNVWRVRTGATEAQFIGRWAAAYLPRFPKPPASVQDEVWVDISFLAACQHDLLVLHPLRTQFSWGM